MLKEKFIVYVVLLINMLFPSNPNVVSAESSFPDIQNHWAQTNIEKAIDLDLVNGYPDGTFKPDNNVSIAEFIKLVVSTESQGSQENSTDEFWYLQYLRAANAKKIIINGEFEDYNAPITRHQAARVIARSIDPQSTSYVDVVYENNIMNGYPDGTFRGENYITRAEAISVVLRMLGEPIGKQSIHDVKIPVLMLHHFDTKPTSNQSVADINHVRNELIAMKNAGYEFILLDDLVNYFSPDVNFNMPKKPAIITIDDGYNSVYTKMYPLAKELNIKMSVAPIGWNVGIKDGSNGVIPRFSWEDMREMQTSGLVDFHNHTYDLHHPENMTNPRTGQRVGKGLLPYISESDMNYKQRITDDVLKLEGLFEQELGIRSNFMVYPYGSYTRNTENIIKEHFTGSLSVKPGVRTFKSINDLWEIPRINVDDDTNILREISKY